MDFVRKVETEHEKQTTMWGPDHDDEHTLGNWFNLIEEYAIRLLQGDDPFDTLVKIAALCQSAHESLKRTDR